MPAQSARSASTQRSLSSSAAPIAFVLAVGGAMRLLRCISPSARPSYGLATDAAHALVAARAGEGVGGLVGVAFRPLVFAVARLGELRDAIALGLLTSAFDLASAVVLLLVGARLGVAPFWRTLVVAAFVLAPARVAVAVSGLPSSLGVLSMMLLVLVTIPRPSDPSARPSSLAVAAFASLAVCCSIDLVVPVAVIVGVFFAAGPKVSASRVRRAAVLFAPAIAAVALFVALTLRGPPRWIAARDAIEAMRFARLPRVSGASVDGLTEGWRRMFATFQALALSVNELGPSSSGVLAIGASIVAGVALPAAQRAEVRRRLLALAPIAIGSLLLLAVRGTLGIASSASAVLPCAVLLVVVAVPLSASFEDGASMRRGVTLLAVVAGLLVLAGIRRAPSAVHAAAVRVETAGDRTGITSPWYGATGGFVDLEGVGDEDARSAMRRGDLLAYARMRGVRRLLVDERWQDAAFFGRGYRESLRNDPADPSVQLLVADEAEKNEVLRIPNAGVDLGSLAGRELLSDGWRWIARPSAPPRSVGDSAEIVFAIGDRPGAVVELTVASVPKVTHDAQEITVSLDGVFVTKRTIDVEPSVLSVPVRSSTPTRHRLRFFFTDPGPAKMVTDGDEQYDEVAIEVGLLRVASVPELPPRGPALGAPGGTMVLVSGFLRLEGSGEDASVWAVGPRAEIAFAATNVEREHVLSLEVGPPPASPEGDDQVVTVRLGGLVLGSARLVQGPLATTRFVVPPGGLREGVNQLTMTYSRTSHDDVDRALYVRSIRLE